MDCKRFLHLTMSFTVHALTQVCTNRGISTCTLNPWTSRKRPTLGFGHINKLCPIRSMQKLIVGFFKIHIACWLLLQATQLDTSQGLCVGLNVTNCSISARRIHLQMSQTLSSSALPISRHMKIESLGTQAEGEIGEQIEQGILYPCPLVWLIFSEKGLLNHSLDRQPLCPIWLSNEERWMNASFFSSSRCSPIHTRVWLHIIEWLLTCLSSVFSPLLFLICSYSNDRDSQIENAWRPKVLFPKGTGVKVCFLCVYVFF